MASGGSSTPCLDPATYIIKARRKTLYACAAHLGNVVDQGIDHVFDTTCEIAGVEVDFVPRERSTRACDAV